jgi:hypothetical protein
VRSVPATTSAAVDSALNGVLMSVMVFPVRYAGNGGTSD